MQGEILTSGDPYTIPQAGYDHDWDAHGGGAYLHEHLIDDYVSCWQQGLPNGETDASVRAWWRPLVPIYTARCMMLERTYFLAAACAIQRSAPRTPQPSLRANNHILLLLLVPG